MAIVNDPQLPLLSFLITVFTDPGTQEKFKVTPEVVMNDYKLTWEQKVAVYNAGADPLFLTTEIVKGFPRLLDQSKISTNPNDNKPNPVSGDWWASYARFKAEVEAKGTAPLIPNPDVNERKTGDRATMAGLMALLGDELSDTVKWTDVW